MSRRVLGMLGIFVLAAFSALSSTTPSHAESLKKPVLAGSPYDLVNAVNALRASFGLAPYSINSILMSTAQAQADFLAATDSMTHSGPGCIGLTDRLLAAGYPLAGELTAGGFRGENINGGNESKPAEAAVDDWTGDSLHLNTMVSQNLTEIGAGVAVSGGRVYYVIDCARPITSGESQAVGASVEGGTAVPEISALIIPVSVSTPNTEGNVIHEVRPGQTLWQIAITYEVKIDDLKRLNNLFDNNIYPGNKLLVKSGVMKPTASPTETATQVVTSTSTSSATKTVTAQSITLTPTPGTVSSSALNKNDTMMKVMIGSIALALLGAGVFTWLGSFKKE